MGKAYDQLLSKLEKKKNKIPNGIIKRLQSGVPISFTINNTASLLKTVVVPPENKKERKMIIEYDAKKNLPFNSDDIIFDSIELEQGKNIIGVANADYMDSPAQTLLDKKWDYIFFTGSTRIGKIIAEKAAKNLTPITLELGGKSPVAVFNDANQENAINGITAGIFGASGQSCIAGSRLYLQEEIYDEFLEKLSKRAEKIKIGAPMDPETEMGPISNYKQLEVIEKNIKLTLEQGGKLKCGGQRHSFSNEGYYFPATIIECDNHNLPVAENELFGPVLSVMKFKTEEEVVSKMNDNQYGLSSGVYTSDLARGMRVSKAIRAGITFVNTYRLISPTAPFGGIKDSGYGKEAGLESIKDYTRVKTTWFYTSDEPTLDPFSIR